MENLSRVPRQISLPGLRATIILFLLSFSFPAQSAISPKIVINEIAWMGTKGSYTKEWIELYNNSDQPQTLENWLLKAADGIPEIKLTGEVPAKFFYLLERSDDETVPGISADLIYTGALKNEGEKLELYNNSGNLIDLIDCSSGWFGGNNSTKQTMERVDSGKWQTSLGPGGTPKAKNSILQSEPKPAEEQASVNYPSGIIINEVLPSPEGPDLEKEWIEIFNESNEEVDFSGWKISDVTGATNAYTIPDRTIISPRGFLVLPRPTTKITLNNSGDSLNLYQPSGKIIDEVNYEKAPRGQSYNRTESGWAWSSILTPGLSNKVPSLIPETEETELLEEEKKALPQKEKEERQLKEGLATISKQIPEKPPSFLPLIISLGVAVFFGATILFLKKRLKVINNKKV
jgi:hypothetical protein